jgi:hypothetical protein
MGFIFENFFLPELTNEFNEFRPILSDVLSNGLDNSLSYEAFLAFNKFNASFISKIAHPIAN